MTYPDARLPIICDYEAIKRASQKSDNSTEASEEDPDIYVVYCYCRGRDLLNNSCDCFGTPKFFGPESPAR